MEIEAVSKQAVDPSEYTEILSYEKAAAIVEESRVRALGICSCRHESLHAGTKKCDDPLELCFSFHFGAEILLRHGFAREMSKEEALELVQRNWETGLLNLPMAEARGSGEKNADSLRPSRSREGRYDMRTLIDGLGPLQRTTRSDAGGVGGDSSTAARKLIETRCRPPQERFRTRPGQRCPACIELRPVFGL